MRRPSFRLLPYAFVLAVLVTPSMAAAAELPNPYCPVLPDEKSEPDLVLAANWCTVLSFWNYPCR